MAPRPLALIPALLLALLAPRAAAQTLWSPELAAALPDLADRLSALHPDDPRAYFELAEEIADEAVSPEDVRLAQRLFALSLQIDQARFAGSHNLGPSVCLALAQLERIDRTADWLRAMAGALDHRYAATDWNVPLRDNIDPKAALDTATALGLIRAGEGRRARDLLHQPHVQALIRRYEPLLSPSASPGERSRLETLAASWPCPECRNERSVTYPTPDGRTQVRLCNTCGGNPGPRLPLDLLAAHLRFEDRLLRGIHRSWSAQLIVDRAAPLLDPEPEHLALTLLSRYDADPARPLWRNGRWLSPDDLTPGPTPP